MLMNVVEIAITSTTRSSMDLTSLVFHRIGNSLVEATTYSLSNIFQGIAMLLTALGTLAKHRYVKMWLVFTAMFFAFTLANGHNNLDRALNKGNSSDSCEIKIEFLLQHDDLDSNKQDSVEKALA